MPRTLMRRRVSTLKPGSNVRTDPGDEASLRQLGNSLKRRQDTPLLIRADGTIIDGHRRLQAAVLVGIEELDCIVTDENLTAADITRIQMVSVIHRADLPLYDRCNAMIGLRDASPGKTLRELAEELDADPSMPTKLLMFERCIPAVKEHVQAGRLGLRDMIAIGALPPEDQPALLAVKLGGASAEEVGRQSRKRRNGPAPKGQTAKKIRIPLATEAASGVVTVASDEIDLEDAEVILKEALKAVRQAKEKSLDCRTAQLYWKDVAAAAS